MRYRYSNLSDTDRRIFALVLEEMIHEQAWYAIVYSVAFDSEILIPIH